MNRPTAIVLLTCTAGSLVALLALGTLLAVGHDSSIAGLLAWLILGGGTATVLTVLCTVALATAADRHAPWKVHTPPPAPQATIRVVRAALPAGEPR